MRISVELILSLLAQGESIEAILDDYPELELMDMPACIAYAHTVMAGARPPLNLPLALEVTVTKRCREPTVLTR